MAQSSALKSSRFIPARHAGAQDGLPRGHQLRRYPNVIVSRKFLLSTLPRAGKIPQAGCAGRMVHARFLARDASSRSPLLTAPPSPCSCGASIHRRYQKPERSSLSPTVSLLRRAQLHMGEQRCRRPPCVHTAKAGVRRCPLQSTLYTASVCRRCEAHQKRALMHLTLPGGVNVHAVEKIWDCI